MHFWRSRKDILFVDLVPDGATPLIKLYVESSGDYRLTRFGLTEAIGRANLKTHLFGAAILACDRIGHVEIEHLTLLSIRLGECPILVCANQIALDSYRFIDRFPNILMLQKPFRATEFNEMFARMSTAVNGRPKVSTRFLTDEWVDLIILKSGKTVKSRMRNYSAGGMFVEIEGVELSVGDQVQVSVASNVSGTRAGQNHLSGRIVWRRPETDSATLGVGLQLT
jgi:hypothetical protein